MPLQLRALSSKQFVCRRPCLRLIGPEWDVSAVQYQLLTIFLIMADVLCKIKRDFHFFDLNIQMIDQIFK